MADKKRNWMKPSDSKKAMAAPKTQPGEKERQDMAKDKQKNTTATPSVARKAMYGSKE